MKFIPEALDFVQSPYTGLTREHWIRAGKYLLNGIFQHVKTLEDPVLVPRYETEITYPNEHTPDWKKQAEIFEGLARSFFLAAPLLHIEPDLEAEGIPLREYYKRQILEICTPGSRHYVFKYEDMKKLEGEREPLNTYQQTVETCALVICLWMSKEILWDSYTQEEKDTILDFIESYGAKETVPNNWRLFNMLDLAFLYKNGRGIEEDVMRHHAEIILHYYAGDGWYRDGEGFDYYSVWAFQVYAPLWCQWYGYEKEPYLARQFEKFSNIFMENYPALFDEEGWVNMWGRSGLYKNAAVAAFAGNFFLKEYTGNPGLARRICSGALLQFLAREDTLYKGALTLGFYRTFPPMLQSYSCAESPLWAAKAFLCLYLPEGHPFWTDKEKNGIWEVMGEEESRETVLNGPGLCLTNHRKNGSTELRSGKVRKSGKDGNALCCYGKLAYHTKYPWEAFLGNGRESQMYMITDTKKNTIEKPNVIFWHGKKQGVLYRRCFFNYVSEVEMEWMNYIDLADFSVPEGLVRVDKLRPYKGNIEITLGSYGFPDTGRVEVKEYAQGNAKAIVLKGYDSQGREKQMAMTVFSAWEELQLIHTRGTNADTERSIVISASLRREKLYGYEPFVMISQVITRESFQDFSQDEIFSIREISYTDPQQCGGYGPVSVKMKDGREMVVDYLGIEGSLSL